jgi:hypothetical protein
METFEKNTLPDKINGKAELYLTSGFARLYCQRFAEKNNPKTWWEAFVYDMETIRNSFAVYSGQKRSDGEKITISPFAYKTKNALFSLHGKYYVEIVASDVSQSTQEAMVSFAKNFLLKTPVRDEKILEFNIFPKENISEEGIVLHSSSAFGFAHFDYVFAATYQIEKSDVTAFLSWRKTSKEAEDLAGAYYKFLLTNGASELKPSPGIPTGKAANMMDTIEIIFAHGRFIGGVRGSENKVASEKLATILYSKVKESASGK